MKQIMTIESTLEARRLLRSSRLELDNIKKQLNRLSMQSIRSGKGVNISKSKKLEAVNLLKDIKYNVKLVEHIKSLLATHLYENSNLNNKLQRQAQMLITESNDVQRDIEYTTAGKIQSTKTDDPLKVILMDLHKRLSKHPNTTITEPVRFAQNEDDNFGALTVSSNHSTDRLFVVLTTVEGKNKYKTFLNEMPIEHDVGSMIDFISPSQLYKVLVDVLTVDRILRS